MSKLLPSLLLVAIVALVKVAPSESFFPGIMENYQKEYPKISKYLVKTTKSDDPDTNMGEVMRWQNSFPSTLKEKDNRMWSALNHLVKMKTLVNDCSALASHVIIENHHATKYQSSQLAIPKEKLDRVSKLVREFAQRHERNCRDFYLQALARAEAKMDKFQLKQAESLINGTISSYYKAVSRGKSDQVVDFELVGSLDSIPNLLSILREMKKSKDKLKFDQTFYFQVLDRLVNFDGSAKKFKILETQLTEPCRRYNDFNRLIDQIELDHHVREYSSLAEEEASLYLKFDLVSVGTIICENFIKFSSDAHARNLL